MSFSSFLTIFSIHIHDLLPCFAGGCAGASCLLFENEWHHLLPSEENQSIEGSSTKGSSSGQNNCSTSPRKCIIALFPHTTDSTSLTRSIPGQSNNPAAISPGAVRNCDLGGVGGWWGDVYRQSHRTQSLQGNQPVSSSLYTVCHWSNH